MVLSANELEILMEDIIHEITEKVTFANRTDTLKELLAKWDLARLIKEEPAFESYSDGTIVVIGQSEVKESELRTIAKKAGVKNEFEFCLGYYENQKYNYRKLMYAPTYRVVMFGPIPHSTTGKGNSSSVIAEMESKPDMYPRVVRLGREDELKITKSGFKKAIYQLLDEGYIEKAG